MEDKKILSLVKLNGVASELYSYEVNKLIRKKYSEADVEAILNNYIADPTNEQYASEFKTLQEYRKECKDLAKTTIGLED